MDLEEKVEYILIGLIMIVLGVMFFNKEDVIVTERVYVGEEEFAQYPLVAWQDTHEKWDGKQGDIVKIKYRVKQSETKLWMYNRETGKLVHEQSLVRNPKKDGTPRDLTYVWKLYKSERSQYIPPGDYDIVRGGPFEPVSLVGKLITTISI